MKKPAIMCLLFMMLILSACSPTPQVESDIIADAISLCHQESVFYESENTEGIIIFRVVDTNENADHAEVHVTSSNDIVAITYEYILDYQYSENKWNLDQQYKSDQYYTVLSSPITESDALGAATDKARELQLSYSDVILSEHQVDLDTGKDVYSFSATRKDGYTSATDNIVISYVFGLETGWVLDESIIDYGANKWNIEGIWEYHNSTSDMILTIHDISDDEVKIEYDFDYECPARGFSGYYMSRQRYNSTRVETRRIYEDEDGICFPLLDERGDQPTIYITKAQGVTFDGVWDGYDDTFIFAYEGKGYEITEANGAWDAVTELYNVPFISCSADMRLSLYEGMSDIFGSLDRVDLPYQTFDLYGQYGTLQGKWVLTHEKGLGISAVARIYGDGKLLYEFDTSSITDPNNRTRSFSVDVTGIRELRLEMPNNQISIHGLNANYTTIALIASELTLIKSQ